MTPVEPHRGNISVASAIGAFLLCLTCLPGAAAEKSEQSGAIVRRRAEVVTVSEWTKYCASLSMNGVATGERDLSTVTVPRLQLLWSRTLSGPVASAPSV